MTKNRPCIATLNYDQKKIDSWQDFEDCVTYWVTLASDYSCHFICLPEFLTLQLLSIEKKKLSGHAAVKALGPIPSASSG